MQKIILSCAVVLSVNCVYAQKSNVNKANAAIAAAAANSKEINYEKIDEAWALIQPAMTDPVSSIMPETWNAAGRIQVFYMNKMLTDRNTTGELDTKKFFENQKMIVEYYSKCDELEHTPNKKGKLPKEVFRPINQTVAKGARANLINAGGMLATSDPDLSIMYINYFYDCAKNSIFTGLTDLMPADSVQADINYYLATAYKTKGDDVKTMEALEKSLTSKQYGKYACGELIILCDKHGKKDLKEKYTQYGYDNYPELSQYGQWLVVDKIEKQDWEGALKICEELITRFPDDKFAYYNKGRVMFEQKKYDEAFEAYVKASEVDSDNAEALSMAGRCQYMKASVNADKKPIRDAAFKTAIEYFTKVESIAPERTDLFGYELYVCYTNTNQAAKAKPYSKFYNK